MDTIWSVVVAAYLIIVAAFLIALLVIGIRYLKKWQAQARKRQEEIRRQEEARVAEQKRLEQKKQLHLDYVSNPGNFDALSPNNRRELERILLRKLELSVRAQEFGRCKLFSGPRSMRVELYMQFPDPEQVLLYHSIPNVNFGKKRSRDYMRENYITFVSKQIFAAAEKVFEIHPRIEAAFVSCFTPMLDTFGNKFHGCFLSVVIERDLFKKFNLNNLSPIYVLEQFSPRLEQDATYMLKSVEPFQVNSPTQNFQANAPISIEQLQTMDPYKFEKFVRTLMSKMGFQVTVTQPSRDGGVDVIAQSTEPLKKGKIVVQCKRYKQSVGVTEVKELYGTMVHEGAMKSVLITTSDFTTAAKDFVKGKTMELIDGIALENLVAMYFTQAIKGKATIN